MHSLIVPGALVHHPEEYEQGMSQAQSVIGNRAGINFEHAGKHLINTDVVQLCLVSSDPGRN